MLRNVLAAMVGVIIGGIVVFLIESLGHQVYPLPDDFDANDAQAIANYIMNAPVGALLFVLLAWFLGALCGTLVATRMTGKDQSGWVAGVLLFALAVVNLVRIPHPVWFWLATPPIYAFGTFLGISIAQKKAAPDELK